LLVELVQPLAIDKGLQDPAHLELVVAPVQPTQKSQLDDPVDMLVDAVQEARLVAGVGQEQAHQFDDVLAAEDQPRVAAGGVEFGELLAQQHEQQADRIGERAARHQPRQFRFALRRRALAQIGIALGLVEHQFQSEHRDVVAHARLQGEQGLPQGRIGLGKGHALHQRDQDEREIAARIERGHCRLTRLPRRADAA
jgi:hypothetical protein